MGVVDGGNGFHNRRRGGVVAAEAVGGSGSRGGSSSGEFRSAVRVHVDLQIFLFFSNWDVYSCWNFIVVIVNRIIGNVSCLD